MSDDIVTRLRECWCSIDYTSRSRIDPECDHDGVRAEAADEIERLRAIADDLASHLRGYICQCQMSKCKCGYDDVMDAYEDVRGKSTN